MIGEIALPSGESIPVLGQGTRGLAEGRHPVDRKIAALRVGLDLGLSLIDTSESYADGAAERLLGVALAGRRDEAFIVSKVDAAHATRDGTVAACERSLDRLATDRVDLYLLQSRGEHPLEETVDAFEELRERGLIRHWGVGGFSVADLAELAEVAGAGEVQAVQVLYSLARREIERDVLPACVQSGLPLLASSPLDGGRIIASLLPHRAAWQYAKLEPWGLPVLILLILPPLNVLGSILDPLLGASEALIRVLVS